MSHGARGGPLTTTTVRGLATPKKDGTPPTSRATGAGQRYGASDKLAGILGLSRAVLLASISSVSAVRAITATATIAAILWAARVTTPSIPVGVPDEVCTSVEAH